MEQAFYELFELYGIIAVFALCTIEGDITLLLAGVLAHNGNFGSYSFLKVYLAGTAGGMVGDTVGFYIGRFFKSKVQDYGFYKMAQPRIERLTEKFGGYTVIVSKYIYGIRGALCLFNGMGGMSFKKFIILDFFSCSIWVLILAGVGFFFSGAISTIIGDFHQYSIYVFAAVVIGIIVFYLVERYLLSAKIEEADPQTIHKIETVAHDIGERLHLTHSPDIKESEQKEESQIENEKSIPAENK